MYKHKVVFCFTELMLQKEEGIKGSGKFPES